MPARVKCVPLRHARTHAACHVDINFKQSACSALESEGAGGKKSYMVQRAKPVPVLWVCAFVGSVVIFIIVAASCVFSRLRIITIVYMALYAHLLQNVF